MPQGELIILGTCTVLASQGILVITHNINGILGTVSDTRTGISIKSWHQVKWEPMSVFGKKNSQIPNR